MAKNVRTRRTATAAAAASTVGANTTAPDNHEWLWAKKDLLAAVGKTEEVSWTRVICTWVGSLFASIGAAMVGFTLTELLVMGALALSPTGWLALAVLIVGWTLTFFASYMTSKFVAAYIHSGTIDRHASWVGSRVRNFFSSREEVAA